MAQIAVERRSGMRWWAWLLIALLAIGIIWWAATRSGNRAAVTGQPTGEAGRTVETPTR